MPMARIELTSAVLSLALMCGSAWAGSLEVQDAQGVQYVSGGVGQDERDELEALKDRFNLLLMFAAQGGAFLSEVQVRIEGRLGRTLLDAMAEGPFLYVAVPPGSYTVTATVDGRSVARKVAVGSGRARTFSGSRSGGKRLRGPRAGRSRFGTRSPAESLAEHVTQHAR